MVVQDFALFAKLFKQTTAVDKRLQKSKRSVVTDGPVGTTQPSAHYSGHAVRCEDFCENGEMFALANGYLLL